MPTVPERIIEFRRRFGLTQKELGELIGEDFRRISRWERNAQQVQYPRLFMLAFDELEERMLDGRNRFEERSGKIEDVSNTTGERTGSRQNNRRQMGGKQNENRPSHHSPAGVGPARTIAVFNQSGGVGKSTLTRDLGYELASRGKKLLLIDADAQGSLGLFFGIDVDASENFWVPVCSDNYADLPLFRIKTSFGLDLAPSNIKTNDANRLLELANDPARIRVTLDRLRPEYDLILVDCPPHVNEITRQILTAIDELVIPVQTERKATHSFAQVQREIVQMDRRRTNLRYPPARILGVVPTLYNPQRVAHQGVLEFLRDQLCKNLGYHCFPAIRDFIAVTEASIQGAPIQRYSRGCPVNADLKAIADTILGENR